MVDALEFDLMREKSSGEGELDETWVSAPHCQVGAGATVEDPPNTIQPSLLQDLQYERRVKSRRV